MTAYNVSEQERLIANLIRVCNITAVDLANYRCQVDAGGMESDWLPWLALRAGAVKRWSPPTIGEQCLLLSPYGDMGQGIVLLGINSDGNAPPSASADKDITQYPDGSSVEYDSASNTLTVNVSGNGNVVVNCKVATVHASTGVTLDTPQVHATGNMQVDGNLGVTGAMAVQGVGASGAVSTFAGSIQVTGGDVKADGIGLKSHHHQEHDGPNTGAAIG